jgi:NAD(P)-dependent dehydrogenase (short-subunit alcohol dehydrogenase family)
MPSRDIAGKTVFITGAGGGIGRKLVPAFLAAGARRIIAADRAAGASDHAQVEAVALDITEEQQIAAAAAKYAGSVDILVNNAGHNHNSRFLDTDPSNAQREMQVNYFGTLAVIRAFAPAMRARRDGTIVNMITVGAHVSFPNMGSYCASKAALHLLTQTVRAELGYHGVDVVGIYPPAVDTQMSAHVPPASKISPQEVANGVIAAIRDGEDEIYIGMAADLRDKVRLDSKAVENMLKSRVAPAQS